MFNLVVGLYVAVCLICVLVIALIVNMESNDGKQSMLAYMICALVQNVGYLFELMADTPEAAMVAYRMQYLGSTYVIIFLSHYVYYFLRIERPRKFFRVLAAINTVLMFIMWFDDELHLFYRERRWVQGGGHWHFSMSYGPAFYLWMLCCCVGPFILVIGLLFMSSIMRKTKFERRQAIVLSSIASIPLIVLLAFVFVDQSEYDFNPMVLGMTLATLTIVLFKSSTNEINQLTIGKMSDRLDEIVIITNDLGVVIDCNQNATDFFGPIRNQKLDQFEEKKQGLDRDQFNRPFEMKGKVFETRVDSICAGNGRIIGYLIMLFDTTKLHETMEELKVMRDAAENANQAKSTFLSNMSHEIRTPMNTIVGITEILLGRIHDKEDREYLENIKSSGDALISIINEILDFSKIESGDIEIVNEEYSVLSVIQDLGMMFLNRIGEKPIELLFDIDTDLPARVVGDSTRLRQIIINIVNNSIKYTNGGYIKLCLECERTADDRYNMIFSVTDTGIGIKAEDMGKLFDNFTRVDMEHNHTKEGTGLGLTIAKRLVEHMEGTIQVESIYGMGSKFTFNVIQGTASTREPAVNLDSQNGKNVSVRFRNTTMISSLVSLVNAYHMNYIMRPGPKDHIDYFFTDLPTYFEMQQKISLMKQCGTKVIILKNPMDSTPRGLGEVILNKPLYSLSFANAVNGTPMKYQADDADKSNAYIAPGVKILLVDDNNMNLKVAKGLLEPLQVTVETAGNGEEALECIEQSHDYDLILMDHMMPIMDGEEATRILRSRNDEYCRTVPIVALTANAIVGVKEKFLAAGMNDMVSKPVDVKELYRVIRSCLPEELIIDMGPAKPSNIQPVAKAPMRQESTFTTQQSFRMSGIGKKEDQREVNGRSDNTELPDIPGVDVKKGLAYSHSFEFLSELFGDFCAGMEEKTALIHKLLEEEDFKNYTIEVHGLKGTARMIGATDLGEQFYELEKLGKAEDIDQMKEKTDSVLEAYNAMKPLLQPYCKE